MNPVNYPVLEERPLAPVHSGMFRAGRREPADLPRQIPGTVLVLEGPDGGYERVPDRSELSGREPAVVAAVSASLIDTRTRLVQVELPVPSRSAANDFDVTVMFECRVEVPEVVAASGLRDLTVLLASHLKRDAELRKLGSRRSVEEINEIREEFDARITAYCTVRAPKIAGMMVRLVETSVPAPGGFREHATALQDVDWDQERQRKLDAYEADAVTQIHSILQRGPEAVGAFGVHRGQVNLNDLMDRSYEKEESERRALAHVLDQLHQDGHLSTMPVDSRRILDTFLEKTLGSSQRTSISAGGGWTSPAIGSGDLGFDADEQPAPLDDEDFDD